MSSKGKDNKENWKQKIVSLLIYGVNLVLACFPYIIIGDNRYNIFRLALRMKNQGLEALTAGTDVWIENLQATEIGIWMELALFAMFMVLSIAYMAAVIRCPMGAKSRKINVGTLILAVVLTYAVNAGGMISICTDSTMSMVIRGAILVLSGLEFVYTKMMEQWEEINKTTAAAKEKEHQEKQEKKERLAFEGKYSRFFYQLIWKNFKSTWKDYVLLLGVSCMVYFLLLVGFGLQRMLGTGHHYEGIQLLEGLDAILMNAILPLMMISVIIIVILIFYYLKCRARSYGIIHTLGMRKRELKYFIALEFVSMLALTFLIGGASGTGILFLFSCHSEELLGVKMGISDAGVPAYLEAAGMLLFLYLVSFMAARDLSDSTNIGRSADLNEVGEKLPLRHRKVLTGIGAAVCIFCIYEYAQLRNHENIYLLAAFFAGIFLCLRYGMAEYLIWEKSRDNDLKNLLPHNQLFHKSRTSSAYVFIFAVIWFCILFYFSFQMISVSIAENEDVIYPYDVVCIADDGDEEFFERLQEKYEIEFYEYPMVRVTAYDATEQREMYTSAQPPQGQHIGISESTYHALKRHLDPEYQEMSLELDPDGGSVYLVHQQDRSVKAQRLDYFTMTGRQQILHVGVACDNASLVYKPEGIEKGYGFQYIEIQGEETGSLTGTFQQGLRENLVVFSDEYFEKARELWKTTNAWTGRPVDSEISMEEAAAAGMIVQGPTKLVLMNVRQEDEESIAAELEVFRERHERDEAYDSSVHSFYLKSEAVEDLHTERLMKQVMNLLVLIAFLLIYCVMTGVKMLTEYNGNRRRAEFLNSMGMRRKERIQLARRETFRYYCLLPMTLAVIFALIFTGCLFHARIYQAEVIGSYLSLMVPLWGTCIVVSVAAEWGMATAYAHKLET